MTQTWADGLHAAGFRVTGARLQILGAISERDHPTIDEIHHAVTTRGIALATVYRGLETLEAAHLIWAVHVPVRGRVYHLHSRDRHAHLACRGCGALRDVAVQGRPALDEQDGRTAGFTLEHVETLAIGQCLPCERSRGNAVRPRTGPGERALI